MYGGSVRAIGPTYATGSGVRHSQLARDPEFQLASVRSEAGILPGSTSAVGRQLPLASSRRAFSRITLSYRSEPATTANGPVPSRVLRPLGIARVAPGALLNTVQHEQNTKQ